MRVAKKFCSSIFPSKGISCHYIQNFSQGDDSFNQKKMYERISTNIKLYDEYVPWSKTDLSYLAPSQFFENYMQKVNNAK